MKLKHTLLVIAMIALSACVTDKEVKQKVTFINKQQKTISTQQKKTAVTLTTVVRNQAVIKEDLSQLAESIEHVMAKIDEQNHFYMKATEALDKMNRRVTELYTITVDTSTLNAQKSESIRDQLEMSYTNMQKEIRHMRLAIEKIKPAGKTDGVGKAANLTIKPLAEGLKKATIYKSAYKNYLQNSYKQAAYEFAEYIKRFPGDDLSDNCQFWLAESMIRIGQKKEAVAAFNLLPAKYPTSPKAATALYRIYELTGGREPLENIVKNYPDSYEAANAEDKLSKIKKKQTTVKKGN